MIDSEVKLSATTYGKTGVKILFVRRDSDQHDITEYEVSTLLELDDTKDYTTGDNSNVIPTDTQKNTVYVVAQKLGVGHPEEFALNLCTHFLSLYPQVVSVRVRVDTVNCWRRIQQNGRDHKHAFISVPECSRHAEVHHRRGAPPHVTAGLSDLRVLKTTQSAFIDFHKCENTTLQDAEDRVLSTVICADWTYTNIHGLDFCQAWETVQDCIIHTFAGPPNTGIYSPSVQLTIYDTEKLALARVKQIKEITMSLPNVHYFEVDMTRFRDPELRNTKNVYLPTDKPAGIIKATLKRQTSKL